VGPIPSENYEEVEKGASMLEILSGLSCALDLVEGQSEGHAIRTALFSRRIAAAIGLSESQQKTLILASLLKDTGCSACSARVHRIFKGDDHLARTVVRFIDWSSPWRSFTSSIRYSGPNGRWTSWLPNLSRGFSWPQKVMQEVGEARRRQGAEMAAELGCSSEVSQIIRTLDEHWDGRGAPQNLRGEQIPLGARIVGMGQVFDAFAARFGMTAAFAVLQERSSTWFDPVLVQSTKAFSYEREFWNDYSCLLRTGARTMPGVGGEPPATERQIDAICTTFARIIDAKSAFSAGHSPRVAAIAYAIASELGLDPDRRADIRRAGLLHDIGKLGVPSAVLDKSDRLTPAESSAFRAQVRYTQLVLRPIRGFDRIAHIAFAHHEGLDGSGFWRGLSPSELDLDQQILAVSDFYDALVSERPYKQVVTPSTAFQAIAAKAGEGLDPRVLDILERWQQTTMDGDGLSPDFPDPAANWEDQDLLLRASGDGS
jgi:HD-GYP domain-containing protein (c-di-GMP phosphodiesterase class II)